MTMYLPCVPCALTRTRDGVPVTSLRELRVLQQCPHPNIVRLKAVVTGSKADRCARCETHALTLAGCQRLWQARQGSADGAASMSATAARCSRGKCVRVCVSVCCAVCSLFLSIWTQTWAECWYVTVAVQHTHQNLHSTSKGDLATTLIQQRT